METEAHFRFYAELNDLLPGRKKRQQTQLYPVRGKTTVKDAIESFDIPHTQVDLIMVHHMSVTFDYIVKPGDYISVYPMFESIDISPVNHLRPKPLRHPAFILDVHLGKLARLMRMDGLDTLYRNDYEDLEIIQTAQDKKRIILTRDKGLLKHKIVTHGYWINTTDPENQFVEVIRRFDLVAETNTFSRCIYCNAVLEPVNKEKIENRLQAGTKKYFTQFMQCPVCKRIYWQGSHYEHMKKRLEELIKRAEKERKE